MFKSPKPLSMVRRTRYATHRAPILLLPILGKHLESGVEITRYQLCKLSPEASLLVEVAQVGSRPLPSQPQLLSNRHRRQCQWLYQMASMVLSVVSGTFTLVSVSLTRPQLLPHHLLSLLLYLKDLASSPLLRLEEMVAQARRSSNRVQVLRTSSNRLSLDHHNYPPLYRSQFHRWVAADNKVPLDHRSSSSQHPRIRHITHLHR